MAETIRGINVVIGADTTGLSKALSDVNKKSRDIQSELKQVEKLLKLDPSNTELVAQKQKLLANAIENAREKLDRLRSVQEQVNEQFQRGEISEGQYRAFQRETEKTRLELEKLEQQLHDMEPAVESFGEKMQKAGDKLKSAGEKMSDVGKKLSIGVTAPIVGLGTVATKAAVDFESAFAGVRKTVDATEEEFAQLEQGIRDMSKRMPAAATDIAAVAEAAGQLGIETDNILKFTETMIGLGEATNLTAEEGATQFARFANIVGMSQQDFDRLGSTVVALGNNFATTEAEIVEMGMRLAGQGAQIGLTEAQIMALATAMSSVGIEAEAGGTAMSTVLKRMQTAVSLAGEDLDKFASVARMSAEEFARAFQADPAAALQAFVDGLAASSAAGENLTVILSDLGITGIRESDTLLRLAGANDTLRDALSTATGAWEENIALQKEVEQRYGTTESQFQMFQNKLQDVAITLGEALLPALMDLLDAAQPIIEMIADWARKFADMDEKTQKAIVAIAGIAAAIGPALIVVGKLTSGIGSLISVFGRMSGAAAGAAASFGPIAAAIAAAVAATAALYANWDRIMELSGPLKTAILVLAAPFTLIVGAIKGIEYAMGEAIPEIDRFGDEVSEATQQAVGAFMDLNDKATVELNQLAWSGQTVTQEMADSIVGTIQQMGDQTLAAMEEKHAEELESMQAFFASAQGLTEEEQAEILAKVREGQELQRQAVEEGQGRIEEILRAASEEKRGLTREEADEIRRIQQQMLETGIEMMSESELEQKAILERMRANASALTARQAAEVVQNSRKQRDEAIRAAEDQYNDVVKNIIRQRDELGTISKEQADKLIAEAQRQRDETIARAQEMHAAVVEEAQKQAGEHVNKVNWETGEVKKRWQVLRDDVKSWMTRMWEDAKDLFGRISTTIRDKMSEIRSNITDTWNNIMNWLRDLRSRMVDIGKYIIQGLIDGIKSLVGNVMDAVKGIADAVTGGLKNALSIRSPSRVLMQLGEYTGEGFALGLERTIDTVRREAAEMAAAVTGGLDGLSTPGVSVVGGVGAARVTNVSMEGMFAGANFYVRSDADIQAIARELYRLQQGAMRGVGLA
jgi:TP901 family phage tail tape measure protein